ncbi:MAG: hypothetical protein ACREQZ_03140 [Woeseiaceae bacterium]
MMSRISTSVLRAPTKPDGCDDRFSAGKPNEGIEDRVRVTHDGEQTLPARAARPGKPVLDRPLAGTRPPHHRLRRLMRVAQLLPQRATDGRRIIRLVPPPAIAARKDSALLRQHFSIPRLYTDG